MNVLTVCLSVLFYCYSEAFNLPGPQVYVVTPSTKLKIDEGRSAPQPFYYHNWMKRMDTPQNKSTTTTTPSSVKTPDLIFAEFEADNMKNIKKLLEKEIKSKATSTTTTTGKPIYVADEGNQYQSSDYGLPSPATEKEEVKKDMTDYFALYNNMYENNNAPVVYQPQMTTTTQKTTSTTKKVESDKADKTDYFALYNNLYSNDNAPLAPIYLPSTSTPISTTTSTTTAESPPNVENIWHIIDSQKHDQYSGQWKEVPIGGVKDDNIKLNDEEIKKDRTNFAQDNDVNIYNNFALPGFGTKPGSGENESRAIRTEPNIRFPYVDLKPLQMKSSKNPLANMFSYNQKGNNNMFTNLDNFMEVKNPVRGEVEDVGFKHLTANMPVDRYNPAQPYLPGPTEYGSKSKQSSPPTTPVKTYANLVPPPLPPSPKVTANDFPPPSTYESFPPFASPPDSAPPAPPVPKPMPPIIQPSIELSSPDLSDINNDGSSDSGYQYKRPSPPSFLPTVPPPSKPFGGYSYDKPPIIAAAPPTEMDDKPEFQGYNYDKQPPALPEKPAIYGYHHDKPDFPSLTKDHGSSFDHGPPHHDSDYPELVYDKPHGNMNNVKGSDDMKGDAMGMVPPPMADANPGPVEDSGFPHDFPGDFKYHHDFDDHDFYHHHHHHPTTTTTETPRVNRFSYYYLGKKLYYLPLYFSVYFIVYVAALIIKAVLRHKIVYPNSWRPNNQAATFFSKRSIDSMDFSTENLHEITGRVTHAIATAAERYMKGKNKVE